MKSYVQIAVNVPSVTGVFDYSLPQALSGQVGVGHLVVAPFGKQTVQGVVLRFVDQPSVPQVKDVIALVDSEPVLTSVHVALAEAVAQSTLSPLAAIVGLFLPPGLSQQSDTLYELRQSEADYALGSASQSDAELSKTATR